MGDNSRLWSDKHPIKSKCLTYDNSKLEIIIARKCMLPEKDRLDLAVVLAEIENF